MYCFYPKITLLSCSYKNVKCCNVVLLFSAEMQMIVPRFSTHVGITNTVKQRTIKSTNNLDKGKEQ